MGFNFSLEPTFEIAPSISDNLSRESPTSPHNLVHSIWSPPCAASRRYSTTDPSFIGADLPGKFWE